MNMRTFFAAICIVLVPAAPAFADELQVRKDMAFEVTQAIAGKDFQKLDSLELAYRSGERTPAGTPKLGEYYSALTDYLPPATRDDGCSFLAQEWLDEWQARAPNSAAQHIERAAFLVDRAWCFRGAGYTSEVPEDAWTGFHENIAAAAEVLESHKATASQDPEYYAVLADIYRAQGKDRSEFQALIDEAVAKNPYYYRLYWSAYTYNQPQWFGSASDIDKFARFSVERTRERDGAGAYARYYWHAMALRCDCWRQAIDWPMMKQGMQDVAKRNPDPWNLANFARISCRMNDPKTAGIYFKALGSSDGAVAWGRDTAAWQACRASAGF